MILLKTILVATDFSPASDAALTYGRELASNFGAQLLVAHVAGNVLTRPYAGGDGISFVDPALQSALLAELTQLDKTDARALDHRELLAS